jgi:hypothetical protein
MLISNPKAYNDDQILNYVNEIKGETTVAISNFSNEPKTLKTGLMVGFYEKLGDETNSVNVTNDLGNNWTKWRSIEYSVKSCGQSGQIVVGA